MRHKTRQGGLKVPLWAALLYTLTLMAPDVGESQSSPPRTITYTSPRFGEVVPKDNAPEQAAAETKRSLPVGFIRGDLPWRVQINRDFPIDLWLEHHDRYPSGPVPVFMEHSDTVTYTPRQLVISSVGKSTVIARVLSTESGLAEIIASSSENWESMRATVDAGFSPSLEVRFSESLDSGKPTAFTVDLVDSKGESVSLDAPASLHIEATNAVLQAGGSGWSRSATISLVNGASSSAPIEIKANSWQPDNGILKIELRINGSRVILSKIHNFAIEPQWWIPLTVSVLGALLHALYEIFFFKKKNPEGRDLSAFRTQTVAAAVLSGILAFLLANWDVLGIQVDTTSLRGFFILGFLFSYMGADLIIKKIVSD